MIRQLVTASGRTLELKDSWLSRHLDCPQGFADTILHQINTRCLYQPLFAGLDPKDTLFLDIGANVGLVTLYALDVCRMVVAVEPSDHYDLLFHLLWSYPNVITYKAALSDVNDPVTLWMCDSNSTMNSTVCQYGSRSLMVQGMTLESLLLLPCFQAGPVVVKVDIEGAEMDALNRLELSRCRRYIRRFYVETHPTPKAPAEHNQAELYTRFTDCGFEAQLLPEYAVLAINPDYL